MPIARRLNTPGAFALAAEDLTEKRPGSAMLIARDEWIRLSRCLVDNGIVTLDTARVATLGVSAGDRWALRRGEESGPHAADC